MAYEVSTGSTSIEYGASLRIGYRIYGSADPFTYVSHVPTYNELPYTFSLPTTGTWEISYTQICPSCAGSQFSTPETAVVTVYA